jgi:hypothetical protein
MAPKNRIVDYISNHIRKWQVHIRMLATQVLGIVGGVGVDFGVQCVANVANHNNLSIFPHGLPCCAPNPQWVLAWRCVFHGGKKKKKRTKCEGTEYICVNDKPSFVLETRKNKTELVNL